MSLHELKAEVIEREVVTLRAQIAALTPPQSMLQAREREVLQRRLWTMTDELRRRLQPPARKARSAHWWTRRRDKPKPTKPVSYRAPVEDRINKEADGSLARALGIE